MINVTGFGVLYWQYSLPAGLSEGCKRGAKNIFLLRFLAEGRMEGDVMVAYGIKPVCPRTVDKQVAG